MRTAIVQIDDLVELIGASNTRTIVEFLGIDLDDCPEAQEVEVEWHEQNENLWWKLSTHCLLLGDCYALVWTKADGAGVDDLAILERDTDDASEIARDYGFSVASELGSSLEPRVNS